MNAVTVRRAVPADAAALSVLGGASFLIAFAHDHPGAALVDHVVRAHSSDWYAAALARADQALWIAETALGAPVGYAMLAPPALDCPTTQADRELKRLYLLPGWQGGGIGRALLRAVEDEACRQGAQRLLLCVYTANPRAQAFYAREGFVDTRAIQRFFADVAGYDDMIWAKRLL